MAQQVLAESFSEPLNGATTANVEIDAGYSNLVVGPLSIGEQALAAGALQYVESQGQPRRALHVRDGQAALTLNAMEAGRAWFRLPWSAYNGASDWRIQLNPTVSLDLAAHCDGGNIGLNLAGMSVSGVAAGAGAGNVDVVLPNAAANLHVTAKTGAGNVTVEIGGRWTGKNSVSAGSGAGNVEVRTPRHLAARIHVASGLGQTSMPARFSSWSGKTYQSADFESAVDRVEITLSSGVGNVSVSET